MRRLKGSMGEADALAGRHRFTYKGYSRDPSFRCLRFFCDGSCSEDGTAGGRGWALRGAATAECDTVGEWTMMAELNFPLGNGYTVKPYRGLIPQTGL